MEVRKQIERSGLYCAIGEPTEATLRCKSFERIRTVLRTIARKRDGSLPTENLLIGSHLEDLSPATPKKTQASG